MTIHTRLNPNEILKQAGYIPHKDGWEEHGFVRYMSKAPGDRFHARILKEGWNDTDPIHVIEIHYDKDQGDYHSSGGKSDRVMEEIKRIKRSGI